VAVALFGADASTNLAVLPAEVNVHGLLDAGVATEGATDPLAGLAGLLVVRDDPTMRLPGAASALASIGTIVAIDNVLSGTAKLANVVIAEARAYGSAGSYTQGDFRVQRLAPAVQREGESVLCFEALRQLGGALGLDLPHDADGAMGEIVKVNPAYQPAWDLIVGEGIRLEIGGSGTGTMVPVAPPSAGSGMRLISSRDLYTALDAAAIRHPEAERLHRYDHIQVSEEDAGRLGISDEDPLEVTDGTVTISAPASVTERVPAGSVFISSLLQGGAASGFYRGDAIPTVRVGVVVEAGRA
jgi:predicted molibdopterin-dependent oxidoreductase YjgC